MVNSRISVVALLAISFLAASCGKGSGGSGGSSGSPPSSSILKGPVDYVSPENGSPISHGSHPAFMIHNSGPRRYSNGMYEISLYSDSAMTTLVASSGPLAEGADGYASWNPVVELGSDRAYWWKWTASYTDTEEEKDVEYESGAGVFHVTAANAAGALSPYDGGHMDVYASSNPRFAVFNAYTAGDASVTYDFELYSSSDTSIPIAHARGAAQDDGERYTTWTPQIPLAEGGGYLWRARGFINDYPLAWTGFYSFTAVNFCGIGGSRYADRAVDWHRKRECATLAFNDPDEALGPPDAGIPYHGFYSLDFGGELVVEMGLTIVDQPGGDIRVYEFVADEFVEVLAGPSESGPWVSLGVELCPEYCDFDLAAGGVSYARFLRIRDLLSPQGACHETSGADIDSILWIRPVSHPAESCMSGW